MVNVFSFLGGMFFLGTSCISLVLESSIFCFLATLEYVPEFLLSTFFFSVSFELTDTEWLSLLISFSTSKYCNPFCTIDIKDPGGSSDLDKCDLSINCKANKEY